MSLLEVRDLRVTFTTGRGALRAVDGLSFTLDRGRTLSIVGESGSGKSVSSLAIMGLHRDAAVEGSIEVDGVQVVGAPADQVRRMRGRRMAMVFQDPLSSLHPAYAVGEQIAEAYRLHFGAGRRAARLRAAEVLGEVGIPDPKRRLAEYPHQFSGGMRQRVMIAMALACEPELLIADEPTTALDVTVQAQILELIARVQQDHGLAVLMITHDLGVVARAADEVLIMYAGAAVEHGPALTVFAEPRHPYTRGLLNCLPRLDGDAEAALIPIPGNPPSLLSPPDGCRFHPRCAERQERLPCAVSRPLLPQPGPAHRAACHLLEETR
ncbi:ABC transporter ATP-binding protein [Actinokineospora fastidiosa]|uniref:Dipeptide/oligopeptide/nickel ABC transporter ATP-binding protein n=1 Tax=Actinokineospora fastidiosa TaxID=1816 RepID=A0A918GR88_9PSEU|nr:ABC transporter ATP-binding protein [Actinokineospora fastidiosa]GGS53972.1 dipeptide/oligopeptide/nickel ABC transporter ATP-binding protein [Actinokineospora fastidiosa]